MNLEYFIAKRLITAKNHKSSISGPIIKIAVSAIAIGMIMMLVSVATGIGLKKEIRNKISAFNGHITVTSYDSNQSEETLSPISTKQDFYPKFTAVPEVTHIQAIATKTGIIRTESTFEGVVLKGVGKDYDWKSIKGYILEGKLPDVNSNLNDQIIISKFLANRLHLKLGDKFMTFFLKNEVNKYPNKRNFEIVGIFDSGFQEFDANYIIGDIRHIQRMNKWEKDEVGAFEVFVNDFDQIEALGNQVYKATFNKENQAKPLDAQTIVEKYYFIFEWLKMFDINIQIILIVMIFVATINMVVALLVLILERTQMIGILKALGGNNWSIRKIFLYNALYLIGKGLFWGNAIGIGILLVQKHFGIVKLNPENYYVNQAPVYIGIENILLLNLLTVVICFLILLIPSYIITKISPIKAIRYN
ncbi:FtsX-like permease family protein [Flavobacterium antarcticum]|uniref:ABC transporter permease n=1 Tax=Flavobacterium antarcticum TaxID=271155 RepID=UPI0003B32AD9|nr:FtsX-like permease family protein [Flavobacterium antarcticum]